MRVGVHVPQWGVSARRDVILAVALAAEEAGVDSVWVADHIVLPIKLSRPYPYSRSGSTPFKPADGFLDALTTLAVVAGATRRIQIGTSVLVLTIREPLAVAKAIATLDVLSEGRVLLAVGSGWLPEESEAVGSDFHRRGQRLEETVLALRKLWRDGHGAFKGEQVSFPDIVCEPRPWQRGGPPIWLGGTSRAAIRRAVRIGDGWHTLGSSVERLTASRVLLLETCRDAGRDPSTLIFSTAAGLPADTSKAFSLLARLDELGVDNVVLNLPTEDPQEMVRLVHTLGSQLLPRLGAGRAGRASN